MLKSPWRTVVICLWSLAVTQVAASIELMKFPVVIPYTGPGMTEIVIQFSEAPESYLGVTVDTVFLQLPKAKVFAVPTRKLKRIHFARGAQELRVELDGVETPTTFAPMTEGAWERFRTLCEELLPERLVLTSDNVGKTE